MPKFKVSGMFSGDAKATHAKQTWLNQIKSAKEKRAPKWFRRMLKRSKRFSLALANKRPAKRRWWNRGRSKIAQ